MAIKPPIKAVFLDFGDTIVETEPLYVERLRMSFEKIGIKVDYDRMEKAFLEADARSALALIERNPFPLDAWKSLFAAVMVETLGINRNSREVMKSVSEEMTKIKPKRKLAAGAKEFLDFCRDRDLRLGLLSNNDGRTDKKCAEVGVLDYFEIVLDSTIEGIEKPNPEFFKRALDRMKLKSRDVLHVGDLIGCDVIGASKAGIRTVWLHDRKNSPSIVGAKPDYKVRKLTDIIPIIGRQS